MRAGAGCLCCADSPQFSALSAWACSPEIVGSALAFENAIGSAITLASISLSTRLVGDLGAAVARLLLLGLLALSSLWRERVAGLAAS